jgi:hypothetical protein
MDALTVSVRRETPKTEVLAHPLPPEQGLQKNHPKPFGHTCDCARDQLVKNSLT